MRASEDGKRACMRGMTRTNRDLLEHPLIAHLATARRDGSLQSTEDAERVIVSIKPTASSAMAA